MSGWECQDCKYHTDSSIPMVAYFQAQSHADNYHHILPPSSTFETRLRNTTAQKMQETINKLAKARLLTSTTPIRSLVLIAEDN